MIHIIQSWENPTSSKRNEIVFANRNQTYGAYVLRQRYEKNIAKAFILTVSVCISLVLVPVIKNLFFEKNSTLIKYSEEAIYSPQLLNDPIPEIIPELPKTKPEATSSISSFTIPRVIDDIINDNLPLDNTVVSSAVPGDSAFLSFNDAGVPVDTALNHDVTLELTDVQEMPAFPGGTSEMMNYLRSNIHYPPDAKNKNIQGTVYISFVVNKQGVITDAHTMNNLGGGCDEEALRVVKAMPAWTAAKQNGRSVMVRLVLPVQFSLR